MQLPVARTHPASNLDFGRSGGYGAEQNRAACCAHKRP
jgi:hypothetical protein